MSEGEALICRYRSDGVERIGRLGASTVEPLEGVDTVLEALRASLAGELSQMGPPVARGEVVLEPPIDFHEVWAAGVTYRRSQEARMGEAETDAGAIHYDRVYEAERPELFLKATPSRVAPPGGAIAIRSDSEWTVPEPELALWLDPELELVGIGLANDVSARDIEGANPLYLPQAKVYGLCASLGPGVKPCADYEPISELTITMRISRSGEVVYEDSVALTELHRHPADLVSWLGRDNLFPDGAVLMTGTGLVPPDEFALAENDEVAISTPALGVLTNTAKKGYHR